MTARVTPSQARRLLAGLLSEEAPRVPKRRRTPENGAHAATGASAPLVVSVAGLPPTVNHMYLTVRGGGRVLTPEARDWYDRACSAIAESAAGYVVPSGPLKLTIVLYHLSRARDLDNALKAAQDALAKALGFDDKRIDYLAVARGVGKPPRTVYTLESL